jgi:hypothetical protein
MAPSGAPAAPTLGLRIHPTNGGRDKRAEALPGASRGETNRKRFATFRQDDLRLSAPLLRIERARALSRPAPPSSSCRRAARRR